MSMKSFESNLINIFENGLHNNTEDCKGFSAKQLANYFYHNRNDFSTYTKFSLYIETSLILQRLLDSFYFIINRMFFLIKSKYKLGFFAQLNNTVEYYATKIAQVYIIYQLRKKIKTERKKSEQMTFKKILRNDRQVQLFTSLAVIYLLSFIRKLYFDNKNIRKDFTEQFEIFGDRPAEDQDIKSMYKKNFK